MMGRALVSLCNHRRRRFPAAPYYLHDGGCDEELFDESAGGQIVTEADGQVLEDRFHGVARLLTCDP